MDARNTRSAVKLKALINRLREDAEGAATIGRNGRRIAQETRVIASEMVRLWDERERKDSGEAVRAAAREEGTIRLLASRAKSKGKGSVVSLENRGVSFSGGGGCGVVDKNA